MRRHHGSLWLAASSIFLPLALNGAATITIVNADAPGVGFNDAAPVVPVGGNAGTTLGQQRLIAFQSAANKWGATIDSPIAIRIRASWSSLTCTANSAILGSAGPSQAWRDFTNAPVGNHWYGKALANALAGTDQDSSSPDITANFNVNLGNTGCLTGHPFYLGLDANHGTGIDLIAVLLHEFAHGLGFLSTTNGETGRQLGGAPGIADDYLLDNSTNKTWSMMTDAERAASAINTGHLVWNGGNVTSAIPQVLASLGSTFRGADSSGRALMYAPASYQSGSSVSHWDTTMSPNQLMEPTNSSDLSHEVSAPRDLTFSMLKDIGWNATAGGTPQPPDLAIAKQHTGSFTQGQTGATYILTVSNRGAGSTRAAVTVVDNIPSGLTATAISGNGWSCTAPAGPCTRSDVLAAGASYPPITVTVNVSPTASGTVTNTATVSGGGSSAGNTASDPTAIAPSAPPNPTPTGDPIATQSSTLAGYPSAAASSAFDGNTDGNFFHSSVTATNFENNAWWQVDLGASTTVANVVIWNRTDCCASRLTDYWVFVSNTPFAASDTPATLQFRAGTFASHQTAAPAPFTVVAAGGMQGRYVRVQLSGANYLSLAEVQVLSTAVTTPGGSSNLIAGKSVRQSSTFPGYASAAASSAADGNTDGNFFNGSVTATNFEGNPWWQADLGAAATINSIVIWNRTDCCASRLSDYWVFVSNTPFNDGDTPATLQFRAGTFVSHQTVAPGPSTVITFGAQGRYVRVQLSSAGYLSLTEVQAFGTGGGAGNLAQGKPAIQSSTFPGYSTDTAAAAVDGRTDGNFFNGSVTATNADPNAWWQVDLGASSAVGSVVVWNRTDCCGTRLGDYWVFVSDTPFSASDTAATLQFRAGTFASHQTTAPSPSATIPVAAPGRYVRVQLSGTGYLSLAEVQVFGQ